MNLEYLTPRMWETLRKFDYDQLMKFAEMFEEVEV
jgi:hypothetical protein